jgi:CheY-like chemotaxis protein
VTTATSRAEEERQPGGEPPHAPERAPERAALRVLVVDDDAVDRMIVRRALARSGVEAVLDEAATVLEALALVGGGGYDCVLLDYNLPGGDGLTLLRGIRQAGLALPVVMLTGQGGEEVAVELMKAGAADYIAKAALTPARLAQSLRHAVDLARAAAAAERAEAERRASAARTARLQEVTALLASAVSTDEVARLFVTQVRDALHAATAWIGLRASDGAALVALASVGFAPGAIAAFDRVPLEAPLPAADVMRDGVLRAFATRAELVAAYPALAAETAAGAQDGVVVLPLEWDASRSGHDARLSRRARALVRGPRLRARPGAPVRAGARARPLYEGERASRAAAERLPRQLAAPRWPSRGRLPHRRATRDHRPGPGHHRAHTGRHEHDHGARWEQAIHAVARSEQYAACRGDAAVPEVRPTGAGPATSWRSATPRMRMTQPSSRPPGVGRRSARAGRHRRWAAGWRHRSCVRRSEPGLIQLSDKVDGSSRPPTSRS